MMQMCINCRNRGVNQNTFAFFVCYFFSFFYSVSRVPFDHICSIFFIQRWYFIRYIEKFFFFFKHSANVSFSLLLLSLLFGKSKALPIYPNTVVSPGSIPKLVTYIHIEIQIYISRQRCPKSTWNEWRSACMRIYSKCRKGNQYDTPCIHMLKCVFCRIYLYGEV